MIRVCERKMTAFRKIARLHPGILLPYYFAHLSQYHSCGQDCRHPPAPRIPLAGSEGAYSRRSGSCAQAGLIIFLSSPRGIQPFGRNRYGGLSRGWKARLPCPCRALARQTRPRCQRCHEGKLSESGDCLCSAPLVRPRKPRP